MLCHKLDTPFCHQCTMCVVCVDTKLCLVEFTDISSNAGRLPVHIAMSILYTCYCLQITAVAQWLERRTHTNWTVVWMLLLPFRSLGNFVHSTFCLCSFTCINEHLAVDRSGYAAVPAFNGPSDERTPAMLGHFLNVRTVLPC